MSERWPARPAKGVKCMVVNCRAEAVETCLRADAYRQRQADMRAIAEGDTVDRDMMKLVLRPLAWTPSMFLCEEHVLEWERNDLVVRNPKRKQLSLRSVTRELEQIRASLAS